jgi:hypothetical protein
MIAHCRKPNLNGNPVIKTTISILLAALLSLSFISCKKTPNGPETEQPKISWTFDVQEFRAINLDAILGSDNIYPDPMLPDSALPKVEAVVEVNQEFTLTVSGCSPTGWCNYAVEDTLMQWVRTDSQFDSLPSTMSVVFKALAPCKECIFLMYNKMLPNKTLILPVMVTCRPVIPLRFTLTQQDWSFDTTSSHGSSVWLIISGTTNAFMVKSEIDSGRCRAILGASRAKIGLNGVFTDTVLVSQSDAPGNVLTTNERIAVYGATGFPKIVTVVNPRRP